MNKFKEGDVVICIDDLYHNLTIDKVYIVLINQRDDNTILIINDNGQETYYHNSLFITVIEKRNDIINSILDYE